MAKGKKRVGKFPSISKNAKKHLVSIDGFDRKIGIKGAHRENEFLQAIKDNNLVLLGDAIVNSRNPGIKSYQYAVRKQHRTGDLTGELKVFKQLKTVYDSDIYTDNNMFEIGSNAAAKGYRKAVSEGKFIYTATYEGISFRVYLNRETLEIANFHPKQ